MSATGTGKTYAAAFALREIQAKKILFIVHREQIAIQAKQSFEMVFGNNAKIGLVTGNIKEENADLIFVSRVDEAKELSEKFNGKGLKTAVLTGDNNNEKNRNELIEKLTSSKKDECLDYIFTVNVFNEGVDIPEINQIVMLRPTESPIIFVQQLGRGLRKAISMMKKPTHIQYL